MKIVVNLSPLLPPLTGVGHYTREILNRLLNNEKLEDLQGFLYNRWYSRSEIEDMLYRADATTKAADNTGAQSPKSIKKSKIKELLKRLPYARRVARLLMQAKFRKRFGEMEKDGYIYWEPNFIPIFVIKNSFVTVYDLSFVRYPQFHPKERVAQISDGLNMAIKKGANIVTVSEFSRDEIADVYGVSKDNITVVPPGTHEAFGRESEDKISAVKQKYSIDGGYILSVCTVEPRKNLITVCKAYEKLDNEIKRGYKLILAGKDGWLNSELEDVLEPLEKGGFARRIGYVDSKDLPALYSGAALFVYLSLYEGYGMPIAEAIRCETPVLTSDAEPMKSVGGDKAYLANPLDEGEIAAKMEAILTGKEVEKGKGRPFIYDWSESARMMIDIFERADLEG